MQRGSRTAVTLHHLRIFSAVARESGFGRAAEILSLSQSTVSDQIRQLEKILGFEIIDRAPGRRRSVLTPAGEVLLRTCDDVFASLERGFDTMEALSHAAAGSVTVATGHQFSGYVFPRLLEGFRRECPQISVRVEVEPHWRILEDLQRGRLDLAIVVGPVDDSRIVHELLGEFDVIVVAPPDHPFSKRTAIPFKDISEEPLILPEWTNTVRAIWDGLAREHGVSLNVVLETSTVEASLRAVRGGVGLAALGFHCLEDYITDGHLVAVDVQGFPARFRWYVAHSSAGLSRPAEALWDYLVRQAPLMWISKPPDGESPDLTQSSPDESASALGTGRTSGLD